MQSNVNLVRATEYNKGTTVPNTNITLSHHYTAVVIPPDVTANEVVILNAG